MSTDRTVTFSTVSLQSLRWWQSVRTGYSTVQYRCRAGEFTDTRWVFFNYMLGCSWHLCQCHALSVRSCLFIRVLRSVTLRVFDSVSELVTVCWALFDWRKCCFVLLSSLPVEHIFVPAMESHRCRPIVEGGRTGRNIVVCQIELIKLSRLMT